MISISDGSDEELLCASVYCQYSDKIDPYLAVIDRVLNQPRRRRIIIGGDVNAHSPLWHSAPRHYVGRGRQADRRRELVEDLVHSPNLLICNAVRQPYTFSGPNGESNIDVTLATRSVAVAD